MAAQENNMPFIKNLASSDRKIRTAALTSLRTFLSSKHHASSLQPLEILKLWKGLFFALWMCDRPLPQQALCAELADLVSILPEAAVVPWLRGFWATMAQEWTGIDVYRMEKFLLLVRRQLGASLAWAKVAAGGGGTKKKSKKEEDERSRWDAARVDGIVDLLEEWPLSMHEHTALAQKESAKDDPLLPKIIPVGLKLHVLDIWVDEVERIGMLEEAEDEDKGDDESELQGRAIVERINALVDGMVDGTASPAVRLRAKDSLADERLPWNKPRGSGKDAEMADAGDADSWDGFDD